MYNVFLNQLYDNAQLYYFFGQSIQYCTESYFYFIFLYRILPGFIFK